MKYLRCIFLQCLRINEQDASAKIAILTGDYAASVALRLKSITDESQVESIVRHYLSLEQNDIVTTRDLLHNVSEQLPCFKMIQESGYIKCFGAPYSRPLKSLASPSKIMIPYRSGVREKHQ